MKKSASKKTTTAKKRTVSKSSAKTKSMSHWDRYCQERDEFYRCHPQIQWLLAIFIIVFIIYLVLLVGPTFQLYMA